MNALSLLVAFIHDYGFGALFGLLSALGGIGFAGVLLLGRLAL